MIRRQGSIMVGAAGRNVGKTEFACALIWQAAAQGPVCACKVTCIREQGRCPRGGSGCGVCGSLTGRYELDAEGCCDGRGKDTERLRAAGAETVYWLRVRHEALAEGLAALLDRVGPDAPLVIESNSLREVLSPDRFLVIREGGAVKPSCAAVLSQADALIDFQGDGWSLAPERVQLGQQGWSIRHAAGAVILAGGASRRMGVDKSLLPVAGRPLIAGIAAQLAAVTEATLISANDPSKYAFLGLPVIADDEPGSGPLGGIASALARSAHDWNLVVSCDIPQIDGRYVDQLFRQSEGADVVIPRWPDGRWEPLLALYRRDTVLPAARRALAAGRRRIVAMFDQLRVRCVAPPSSSWYRNCNTPEEFAAACEVMG